MDLVYAAHVPAGEGPFPTVIALHGWGASAHDLLGLAPFLHGGEALVLCPQDPMIRVSRAHESRDALLRFGLPLSYREYEMGHEIRPEALRDLVVWLDDKVLSPIRLL